MQGEDLYAGCMVAMAELLLSGCTTASDHHYFYTNGMMCAAVPSCVLELVRSLGQCSTRTRVCTARGQTPLIIAMGSCPCLRLWSQRRGVGAKHPCTSQITVMRIGFIVPSCRLLS